MASNRTPGDQLSSQGAGGSDPIARKVRKIVAEILELGPEAIDPDGQLVEDMGMDSMKALVILAAVEKAFRVKIPEDSLPKMTTVNRVIQIAKQYAS